MSHCAGDCLLEWGGGESGREPAPVPLLKDTFANERKKAKILNFSIAYGKTAHGLSKDWGVSMAEAEQTVARWYADRPEVSLCCAAARGLHGTLLLQVWKLGPLAPAVEAV